jgi:replicative DNA helicase
MSKKDKWKDIKDGYKESLVYLDGRRKGLIKSIKTPWSKFNDATTDGIEWNTITVIGGRPASGKTLIAEQIVRESFALNPDEEFRVLQFQFEMLARTQAIREFSSVIGRSYKYLCSADGKLTDEDLQRCLKYAKNKVNQPINIVDTPMRAVKMKCLTI